jgi:transposase
VKYNISLLKKQKNMNVEITFQEILNLNEVVVTSVEIHPKHINIYCSSPFNEAICPSCLTKQNIVNQKYVRKVRDLSISSKKVYLHITERQFYCPYCKRYFSERFSYVAQNEHFTNRYNNVFLC